MHKQTDAGAVTQMAFPRNIGAIQKSASLDSIGLKHRTDKSSRGHDYLNFYETYFAPLRGEKLNILEIGIFNGASLSTWADYFPHAKIVGADINPATKRFERDRIAVEILDQSDIEQLVHVAVKHGPFDIIIEDGSHMWEHQITSLRTLFPFVRNNGIYVVEDLQTNYRISYKGVASFTCVEYLKKWVDLIVGDALVPLVDLEDAFLRTYGRSAKYINFYRHACLIKKHVAHVKQGAQVSSDTTAGTPLAQIDPEAESKPVRLVGHLSFKGDVVGNGGFINLESDTYSFQGLSISTEGDLLEYRVCGQDNVWTDWSNQFAGTRGKSKLLIGVSVRLRSDVKDRYSLRTIGRFADSVNSLEVSDGKDCVSSTQKPLCGIQIVLTEKAAKS
jgi:hypothetical protein